MTRIYDTAACRHFRYAAGDPRVDRLGFGTPAADLVQLGYAVGPLARGLKRPHAMLGAQGGVHHASNDPRQAEAWWGVEDRFANVFVRTGNLPFPGTQVAVVDTDVKRGIDGPGNFARFIAGNGLALPTGLPVGRSPTGGYHLWLGWPREWGPCPERQSILGGVDVKGDSGYVVVPPSYLRVYAESNDGERGGEIPLPYEWEQGCPCWLPWAPPWLAEWIRTAPAAGRPPGEPGSGGDGIDADQVIANGAEPGKRNTTYYRLACSRYRKHGTSMEGSATVLAEVRAAWEAGDRTGMPWREVLTSIASARRFIEKQQAAERRVFVMWRGRL